MVFVLFAIVETELGVVHSALKRDTIKTSLGRMVRGNLPS